MLHPDRLRRLRERAIRPAYIAMYVVFGLIVLGIFLNNSRPGAAATGGLNHYPPSNFGDMVYGKAFRPFVYRTLVPTTIRLITACFPASVKAAAIESARHGALQPVLWESDQVPPEYALEFLIGLGVMFGLLMGFLAALRYLASGVFDAPLSFLRKIPLIALLLLPPLITYTSFIYDFGSLLFFTMGLALMVRRRFRAYLLLFVLSCINKETTLMLIVVFGIHYIADQTLPRRTFWPLLGIQLLIWGSIKATISYIFRHNEGTPVEFHLVDHNLALLRPFGLGTAAGCLVLAAFVAVRWRHKPSLLRHALWVLPVELGLNLFLGYLDELRAYYEALPVVVLLVADGLGRLSGVELAARPEYAAKGHNLRIAAQKSAGSARA
jgi:hypothetical protein